MSHTGPTRAAHHASGSAQNEDGASSASSAVRSKTETAIAAAPVNPTRLSFKMARI